MHFVKNNILIVLAYFGSIPIFLPFLNSEQEKIVFLVIHFATLINLFLLQYGLLNYVIKPMLYDNSTTSDKTKIVLFIVIKFSIILGAIIWGVHLIGNRIIIPIINYVLLIFLVSITTYIKRKEKL